MSTARTSKVMQRDQAYQALRDQLILQQVSEGEKLSEPVWASRLQVSRTAVREAFARLEAEGLIEKAATTGYVVPTLTPIDIREVLEVRVALESAAIDRACEMGHTDAVALAPLREAIDQQAAFINQGYRLGASEADRRFHRRLVELAGNRRLMTMYDRAPLPLVHRLTMPTAHPTDRPVREHRAIIEAIDEGQGDRARLLLKQHLQAALAGIHEEGSSSTGSSR